MIDADVINVPSVIVEVKHMSVFDCVWLTCAKSQQNTTKLCLVVI